MNKDAFLRLVQQPRHLSDDDLERLEDVAKIFPYCSLAYMLLAQGHYENASMLASQKLRLAAAYAPDRESLKILLLAQVPVRTEPPPAPPAETEKPPADAASPLPDELDMLVKESSRVYLHEQLLPPARRPEERFNVLDSADEETPPLRLGHLNEDEAVVERFSQRLKKSVQRDIIDNFIKSEPRIPTFNLGEKDAFTNRDLSEKSIKPPEIISENLANILIKQGKPERAIEIYERLRLKFPEKNAYFASRIEDLKNL